jgi:hypothetical protein
MARIVVLHGIGQQYLGPRSIHGDVAAALADGVWLAGGPHLAEKDIEIAFYADWFRAGSRKGYANLDPSDIDSELEIAFLRDAWSLAAELEPNSVPSPISFGQKAAVPFSVQRALNALSRSSWLAGLADSFMLGTLGQVRRYFTELETRSLVQQRLMDCIKPDTQLIIGHSLGSIVAYEALCVHTEWPVRAFLTLGSPLGVANLIFDRLQPVPRNGRGRWPGSVQFWVNICDRNDIVALVKELAPLFVGGETLQVNDEVVMNGWHAHDLKRHLTAKITGRAITRGLSTIQ